MNQGYKKWLAAAAFALCTNAAVAAQVSTDAAAVPDASALMAFYGVSLATSPVGGEDKAVWMAKVQGLVAQAPAWLQQNVLASKTKAEFAANLAILESMQKGTLESAATAVKANAAKSGKVSGQGLNPEELGDSTSLVYTPLAPCRIMDTRNASFASGVQGPIAGNSLKQIPGYITNGSNWGQYGGAAASDCNLDSLVGSNIYAVAIVITILNPNFSAYLGVSDSSSLSTVLNTVALNYTGGQGLSTMYIVPQRVSSTIYFAMPAGLSANIIFDVVGYFAISEATALECVDSPQGSSVVADGGVGTVTSGACATGYTLTGGTCDAPVYAVRLSGSRRFTSTTWACDWTNQSGASRTLVSSARCCRVPGR